MDNFSPMYHHYEWWCLSQRGLSRSPPLLTVIARSIGPFDMVTLHFIRDLLDTVDRLQSTKYFIRISDSAVPHVLIFLLNLGTIEGKVLFRKLWIKGIVQYGNPLSISYWTKNKDSCHKFSPWISYPLFWFYWTALQINGPTIYLLIFSLCWPPSNLNKVFVCVPRSWGWRGERGGEDVWGVRSEGYEYRVRWHSVRKRWGGDGGSWIVITWWLSGQVRTQRTQTSHTSHLTTHFINISQTGTDWNFYQITGNVEVTGDFLN